MKFVIVLIAALVIGYFVLQILNSGKAKENIKQGRDFLEQNKSAEGVQTTSSGLQYKVLEPGTGTVHPTARDRVKVHYHGTLIDGTVFDSSVDRGEPITFGLNQVIPGWTEGLQLMVEGEKTRLFIPSQLAYGNRAAGSIKPGSTLIFDVELLGINVD
ncbi:MAG: FKBP-type peptidyl-prolyl cis-trans isomerase [Pseudomonadota bacterium]